MNRVIISIFLILFTIPYLVQLTILIDFKINQTFIAKELCEDREIKESKCNGKCHLVKELTKNESKDNEPKSKTLPEKHKSDLFYKKLSIETNEAEPIEQQAIPLSQIGLIYSSPAMASLFRPPIS